MRRARRVRVFVGEDERYQGRPLFEAIVLAAKEEGLAGATVFKGFMGYAPHADIATAGILRLAENLPVLHALLTVWNTRTNPFAIRPTNVRPEERFISLSRS